MVDFNNPTTVTQGRRDIVNFMVLQRLQDMIDALVEYKLKEYKGQDPTTENLQATITGIIVMTRSSLSKEILKSKECPYETVEDLEEQLNTGEDIEQIVHFLESFLYQKGVLKWDTKAPVDQTDILAVNEDSNM